MNELGMLLGEDMKHLVVALALLALAACSTEPAFKTQPTSVQTISFPPVQQVTSAAVGDAMIASGTQSNGNFLEIKQMTTFGNAEGESRTPLIGLCSFTVAPGRYYKTDPVKKSEGFLKVGEEIPCYGPVPTKMTEPNGTQSFLGCTGNHPDSRVCVDENGFYSVVPVYSQFGALAGFSLHELKKDFQNISVVSSSGNGNGSQVKEFRYLGKQNNTFMFAYREYDDYPHHFVTETRYQYDLSNTNVIGFENMRAQIINANDNQIEFRLLSNF